MLNLSGGSLSMRCELCGRLVRRRRLKSAMTIEERYRLDMKLPRLVKIPFFV